MNPYLMLGLGAFALMTLKKKQAASAVQTASLPTSTPARVAPRVVTTEEDFLLDQPEDEELKREAAYEVFDEAWDEGATPEEAVEAATNAYVEIGGDNEFFLEEIQSWADEIQSWRKP